MKLLMVSGTALLALSLSNPAAATAPVTSAQTADQASQQAAAGDQPTMMIVIDGVAVPFDVQMGIQLKYQGHAVTKVAVVSHNGEQAYRLRVDRDDIPDDFDSIYLYYDMNWQYIDDKKMAPPAQPAFKPEPPRQAPMPPKPKPAPAPEPPAPAQKPVNIEQGAEVGGRGGSAEPEPETPQPDEKEDDTGDEPVKPEKPAETEPEDQNPASED